MKVATVELESVSPLSFSKYVAETKREGESHEDRESRTWRDKVHANEEGFIIIPPMMFKNCLSNAAKYRSEKIVGERNKTWTKKFEAGVMVVDPVVLSVKKEQVSGEAIYVPADGMRGGTKRVNKIFPKIETWKGNVRFLIIDESIASSNGEIFERHLKDAGNFVGIGRFRPAQNGYYGRFKVNAITWTEE